MLGRNHPEEFILESLKVIEECARETKYAEVKESRASKSIGLRRLVLAEEQRMMANNLAVLESNVIPLLSKLELTEPMKKHLLRALIRVPSIHNSVAQECGHCAECPQECSAKWAKLSRSIKELQLTLLGE